jgi:hypothetical protein
MNNNNVTVSIFLNIFSAFFVKTGEKLQKLDTTRGNPTEIGAKYFQDNRQEHCRYTNLLGIIHENIRQNHENFSL